MIDKDKGLVKKTVIEWLNDTDYSLDPMYVPTEFALEFVNFIKLVNGEKGEENVTPVMHYKMLDQICNMRQDTVNLCARGYAKALAVGTMIMTPTGVCPIEQLEVGDRVIDRDGKPTVVTHISETFTNQTYKFILADGLEFIANEDHVHILQRRTSTPDHSGDRLPNGKWPKSNIWAEECLTTNEILERGPFHNRKVTKRNPTSKEQKWFIPLVNNIVEYDYKEFPVDPYLTGIILGDGSVDAITGMTNITSHRSDINEIRQYINQYDIGDIYWDKRNPDAGSFRIRKIALLVKHCIGVNNTYTKHIPTDLLFGSKEQRIAVLRGLMDTDGTITPSGSSSFCSTSEALAEGVRCLVKSLGGHARVRRYENDYAGYFLVFIGLPDINPFRLKRKANRWIKGKQYETGVRVGIKNIVKMPLGIESRCISVESPTKSYLIEGSIVTHNTAIMAEYLFLYLAVYGDIPGFGKVHYALYVGDSIDNNVKKMRNRIERRVANSEFLQEYLTKVKITDTRWYFVNKFGKEFVVTGHGINTGVRGPLALDEVVYTDAGKVAIKDVEPGLKVFIPDGQSATVLERSEVINDAMYKITFGDGRSLKVSKLHMNALYRKKDASGYTYPMDKVNITTEGLVFDVAGKGMTGKYGHRYYIKVVTAPEYSDKSFLLDPYLIGIALGDGNIKDGKGLVIGGLPDDVQHYYEKLKSKYNISLHDLPDKRPNHLMLRRASFHGITGEIKELGLGGVVGVDKFLPKQFMFGSVEQRKELLAGLLDTDGSVDKRTGSVSYTTISPKIAEGIQELGRSLGMSVSCKGFKKKDNRYNLYRLTLVGDFNPFSLGSKRKYWSKSSRWKGFIPLIDIEEISQEPSVCILIDDAKHEFITTGYIPTHNTVELNTRPQLAILDDLISDEDARSMTVIEKVEDVVYSAIDNALHPQKRKIIWSGTPFNAKDPLYKAVESGAWYVSVFPVCEKFPCKRSEFRGGWEDRFDYDIVNGRYRKALAAGKINSFNQELMLRIMSDEEKLVPDKLIMWYKRSPLIRNKSGYNFYITTDFATSEKQSADFSVIVVWAYSNNGDWMLVDIMCKKMLMNETLDNLFKFAQEYNPIGVGIEVNGQQGGFIAWIQEKMVDRKIYFSLVSSGNSRAPGIRRNKDKFSNFQTNAMPLFETHKIWFPEEFRDSEDGELTEMLDELNLATFKGFRSRHDDCCPYRTNVDTLLGLQRIGTLKDGDKVFTYKNDHRLTGEVSSFRMTGIKQVLKIKLNDGNYFECSEYHPVLTDTGYKCARDLQPYDMVVRSKLCKSSTTILSGQKSQQDITSQQYGCMTGVGKTGCISTSTRGKLDQYWKDMKSTILMKIRTITNYVILYYLQLISTVGCTSSMPSPHSTRATRKCNYLHRQQEGENIQRNEQGENKKGRCQDHATGVAKDLSFMRRQKTRLDSALHTVQISGTRLLLRLLSNVGGADSPFSKHSLRSDIVAWIASELQRRRIAVRMTQNSALNVDEHSQEIGRLLRAEQNASEYEKIVRTENTVLVEISEIIPVGMEPTFNFEIKSTHNYSIEGGYIVHNCLDTVSMLAEMKAWKPSEVSMEQDEEGNSIDMIWDDDDDDGDAGKTSSYFV